jgi:PAS domain S-box-containing protein
MDDTWYREIENYLLYPFHMDSIQDILLKETSIDLDKTPYAIINQNGSSFTTISIVRDISGVPAYVARMEIPYQSPYNSLVLGSIGILVFVLSSLFFVVILLYYRYFFARNILALSSILDGAASDEKVQKRISESAPPEIAQLAKSAERITSTMRKHQTDLSCSRENLEEAEERWELIFEEALDPMCVGDEVGILSANRAFASLFGMNRIDIVNLPFTVLTLPLLKDGTSPMESLMQQYYSIPEEGYTRFEWKILQSDQDMTFDVTIKRIRYRGEQLLFVVARDITAQARLHDLQATAIARIEKNLIQLGTLNDTIRNPLTVILGLLEDEKPHYEERIIEQVRKIDAIIDQLDKGFLDSEKVRKYLKRYFEQGKR